MSRACVVESCGGPITPLSEWRGTYCSYKKKVAGQGEEAGSRMRHRLEAMGRSVGRLSAGVEEVVSAGSMADGWDK